MFVALAASMFHMNLTLTEFSELFTLVAYTILSSENRGAHPQRILLLFKSDTPFVVHV